MDYNFGYIECSDSARRHFECSDLLSKNKFYDIAIGHIILGSEESLKSLVYYSYTVDFLKIDNDPMIFKDHSIRHKYLAEIHSTWIEMLKIFIDNLPDDIKPTKSQLIETINQKSESDVHLITKWWKKGNKVKNEGWDVTYANGNWVIPKNVTEVDFREAYKMTLPLRLTTILLNELRRREKEVTISTKK